MKRTHHCAQLTPESIGHAVVLSGWIHSVRDHGGILFVDLRDREGITQVVLSPEQATLAGVDLHHLREESVITVQGEVQARPKDTLNAEMKTGAIEVHATGVEVVNRSDPLPFPLDEDKAARVGEDLRLSYRYLDLRRPSQYKRLKIRHQAAQAIRRYLDEAQFLEIETPTLFKSTPEGAREFLVPSRLNPGHFYALNQSPQQYKQMLMAAGMERYYALARCYRDEDLRADRQPEFTQVDIELSFIDREDIYALIEGLLKSVWKACKGVDIPTPFARMPYKEAMNRYGVDKPDTRFGLEIKDLSAVFEGSSFKVFAAAVEQGGVVKAFNAKGLADLTQGELKALETTAQTLGAKGLAFIKVEQGQWKSPIFKFLSQKEKASLTAELEMQEGDVVFFAATTWERACAILGRIRLDAAELLKARGRLSIDPDAYNFLWVTDFPLLLYDDEQGRYASAHHPFTAPVEEDKDKLVSDPRSVRGQHYDIVLNGVELGGGSIRIHDPKLQRTVFEKVLQLPQETIDRDFGYMLKAFKYGTPPHGGIALGFDRLVAILTNANSIREVIAFPKTQKGQDLMAQSPGVVTLRQLKDLHIASLANANRGEHPAVELASEQSS